MYSDNTYSKTHLFDFVRQQSTPECHTFDLWRPRQPVTVNMELLKNKRRAAKSNFSRISNSLNGKLHDARPIEEVEEHFAKYSTSYEELIKAHENYAMSLDDEKYDDESHYLEESEYTFNTLENKVKDYLMKKKKEKPSEITGTHTPSSSEKSLLKLEKPKLPKFAGDVRDYNIFRSDFEHFIGGKYSERDSIAVLRSCLSGKPFEIIRGVGTNYKEAWDLLDSIFGQPRVLADTILSDISKVKPLRNDEDHRFCEFVQLLIRCKASLKDVGRVGDIDNLHMISVIEQKLSSEDLRLWSRHVETEKLDINIDNLLSWLSAEMRIRVRVSSAIRSPTGNSGIRTPGNSSVQKSVKSINVVKTDPKNCWVCGSSHYVDQCSKFRSLSVPNRFKCCKENHVCFSCLKKAGKDHNVGNCSRRKRCTFLFKGEQCSKYHHNLLHNDEPRQVQHSPDSVATNTDVQNSARSDESVTHVESVSQNSVSSCNARDHCLLPTVSAEISSDVTSLNANILIDGAAQISLIRDSAAEYLGLSGKPVDIVITKVGGERETFHTKIYKVKVKGEHRYYDISAVGIPCVNDDVEYFDVSNYENQFGITLKRGHGPIDLLIGVNHPHIHDGETKHTQNIIARHSPLGWLIFGTTGQQSSMGSCVFTVSVPVDLSDFWTTESMGVSVKPCICDTDKLSPVERHEAKVISDSCEKLNNQWLVPYPWNKDPSQLPNNYSQAEIKLRATERRLSKNLDHAKAYDGQISDLVNLGFAKKLTHDEVTSYDGPIHYISHHEVLRPDNKSTPIRIVFNSSSNFQGHVLNDYWMKGADLLNDLFGVILRFRENEHAFVGDISKMYHRVLIPESDQHIHRFLWRNFENRKPDIYVMKVVTFGDKPAASMAQTALRKTAEENKTLFPEASKVIIENSYMDDICESVQNEADALKLTSDIDSVLKTGGFKIKEWIHKSSESSTSESSECNFVGPQEKVLGVTWNTKHDTLTYKVFLKDYNQFNPLTKRKILSRISEIFDPIGFASPVIIKAKIMMQHLWQKGYDWDENLPSDLENKWFSMFEEIKLINNVNIPRCLTIDSVFGNPMLCVFCDASDDAFGTCIYIRWKISETNFETRFVAAKSRVTPLKKLTIPKLELQAAVLGTRLYQSVISETRLKIETSVFLTDSSIVLGWIKSTSRKFKPFVANRVGEIQTNSDPIDWYHVPSSFNVADKVSRGISVNDLEQEWKHGPDFLKLPQKAWPVSQQVDKQILPEASSVSLVIDSAMKVHDTLLNKLSSLRKLIRVTSYILRFVHNLKVKSGKLSKDLLTDEVLSPSELESAEHFLLLQEQDTLHERFRKGHFSSLSPFIDSEGLLRVGGRLDKSIMSYHYKHPVLLPYDSKLSRLIVLSIHSENHSGVSATVAKVRRKFWIVKVHKIAKSVKYSCVQCRKMSQHLETQFMADLPSERLLPYTPPFHVTAVDYFGPFTVKISRNKTTKHYGVVFVCLNTGAVHLELSVDLSTMEFLQVLRRFFAIRGYPAKIFSDNGTQFVGANRELQEMVRGLDNDLLKNYCAERKMLWQFVTPNAPHQNGCAEAMVKTCKKALKLAVGDQLLTPFELYTFLTEVANIVNERPIGRVPNDPDDGSYICPNDILIGRANSDKIPQGPFRKTENPRHRVEFVQKLIDSFWKTWSRDVLPLLTPRKKWNFQNRNIQLNDIVIVSDSNLVRGKFCIGRIINVFPGNDGKVRNVEVRTVSGTYQRPISKLSVIYPAEGYDEN